MIEMLSWNDKSKKGVQKNNSDPMIRVQTHGFLNGLSEIGANRGERDLDLEEESENNYVLTH